MFLNGLAFHAERDTGHGLLAPFRDRLAAVEAVRGRAPSRAGSAPRLCHWLPSARSKVACAWAQAASGSAGFQTAWEHGRART